MVLFRSLPIAVLESAVHYPDRDCEHKSFPERVVEDEDLVYLSASTKNGEVSSDTSVRETSPLKEKTVTP